MRLSDPIDAKVDRDWRALLEKADYAGMGHDPDWLRVEFADLLDRTYAVLIYEDDEPAGLVTFTLKRWPLYVRAGELKALTIPLTRCCVLEEPIGPRSHVLYDRLFQELAESDELEFDVIYLEVVADDSFLATYLETSAAIAGRFREYRPQGTMEHHQIRFPPSLDAYWENVSPKTRRNLQRKVRKLGKDTKRKVRLVRFDGTSDLDTYVGDCSSISKRSYQFHLLGQGVQDEAEFLERSRAAAKHGWLRGYVLYLDDEPVAFMHGYQYRGVYLYIETAYDQELRKHSPGTVLHVMVLEDMYEKDTPEIFEFGVHGDQKAAFGNHTYMAGQVFLIRPSIYPMAATGVYRLSDAATETAKKALDRFGVTNKVKQMMRRLSVR